MSKQAVRIIIFGQVQGVFFRRNAKEEADKLGLTGWVRNDRDGSVEVMVEGPKEKLDEFVKWCKKGPPMGKVENVEVEWLNQKDEFDSFEIV